MFILWQRKVNFTQVITVLSSALDGCLDYTLDTIHDGGAPLPGQAPPANIFRHVHVLNANMSVALADMAQLHLP